MLSKEVNLSPFRFNAKLCKIEESMRKADRWNHLHKVADILKTQNLDATGIVEMFIKNVYGGVTMYEADKTLRSVSGVIYKIRKLFREDKLETIIETNWRGETVKRYRWKT